MSKLYGDFSRDVGEEVLDRFAESSAVAETAFVLSETVRAFDYINKSITNQSRQIVLDNKELTNRQDFEC